MTLYGLILGICYTIGIEYFLRHATFLNKRSKNTLAVSIIISSVIGARMYHVVDYWEFYQTNPSLIINTKLGGLGILGGILGGFIPILLFSVYYKISFTKITDSFVGILPICQSIGRLGNYINKEIPTWWIEAILNTILFIFINKKKENKTGIYLIGYGLIRVFTEFLRKDTWAINEIKIGQIISILLLLAGICLLKKCDPRGIRTPDCLDESQES